jgi:crossover junction endodeoxyribonuclease RuvC
MAKHTKLGYRCFKLTDIEDHHLKLKKIFERMLWLIENYKPDELAIEAPFLENVQS